MTKSFQIIKGVVRRTVLKRLAALTAVSGSSLGGALSAAAATRPDNTQNADAGDYKALVCIMQFGGNDNGNVLIPTDEDQYRAYEKARSNLAIARQSLTPLTRQPYALHPSLPVSTQMLAQNEAAIVANVGMLYAPTTLDAYNKRSVTLPTQLFSHSSQQEGLFTSYVRSKSKTGWLGRIGDIIEPLFNNAADLPGIYSARAPEVLLQGQRSVSFSLPRADRVKTMTLPGHLYGQAQTMSAVEALLKSSGPGVLQKQLAYTQTKALRNTNNYAKVAQSANIQNYGFPATGLGAQLASVFQAMLSAKALGQCRQVFFTGTGGWDFHDDLLAKQSVHLAEQDDAIAVFSKALKRAGLWDNTLAFTMSDFGRTLVSNGTGSDHGWGGNQILYGGPIRQGKIYGIVPESGLKTKDDVGQGRLIPSTATEQYGAELARWFGVSSDVLDEVFPNLEAFSKEPLGILAL